MVRRKHELEEAKVSETVGRNNCPQEFGRGKALKWVFGLVVVSILGGFTGTWCPPRFSRPVIDNKTISREENELGILIYNPTD